MSSDFLAAKYGLRCRLLCGRGVSRFVTGDIFIDLPVIKAIFNGIRAAHSATPLFHDALYLDVVVPGVLRVSIKVIVMNGELRDVIHDVWGSRAAYAV